MKETTPIMKRTPMIYMLPVLAALAAGAFANITTISLAPGGIYHDNAPGAALAAQVLSEEIESRTGLRLAVSRSGAEPGGFMIRFEQREGIAKGNPEAFEVTLLRASADAAPHGVVIAAPGGRAFLFGAGYLLRHLEWARGSAQLPLDIEIVSAPVYPLRGHQLGYRARANSYDAWDGQDYDQHIRELALFGLNAIENIPFQDDDPSPHMPLSREEMNRRMSEICAKYDLEYWVWTPAVFDLQNTEKRTKELARHEALYRECPRIDGIFFPGGDPGDNHPREVLPFLADLAPILAKHHPEAKIWISLQGFDGESIDYFYRWVEEKQPAWLGGEVTGPSSPPIPESRRRLPAQYALRHYPDITHTVRCQYPVRWWDPAFNVTLGRESINPQPVYYALIHNAFAPYTNGFLTYSDGVNDDVNKIVWNLRGWNPDYDVREMMIEYARYFFGPQVAELAADGILALEKNWEGPLAENGSVSATLALWRNLDEAAPALHGNWRWQMCLVRAYYDAYTRLRLIYEQALETDANAIMAQAATIGPEAAMTQALALVQRADHERIRPDLHERILALFEDLFHSIGLQTSVEQHQASGSERGCMLDFLHYPLNNRWWLEDEFAKIRALPSDADRIARLEQLAAWENPGPGSHYDDVGNIAKSPNVLRGEDLNTDPLMERDPNPGYWWWDGGYSRQRLSFQTTLDFPLALVYEQLDPDARYVIRFTGYGDAKTRANGVLLTPTVYGKEIGEFKEFPVPQELSATGRLVITWDKLDEEHLNWRQQSRIAEAWLIKQ